MGSSTSIHDYSEKSKEKFTGQEQSAFLGHRQNTILGVLPQNGAELPAGKLRQSGHGGQGQKIVGHVLRGRHSQYVGVT